MRVFRSLTGLAGAKPPTEAELIARGAFLCDGDGQRLPEPKVVKKTAAASGSEDKTPPKPIDLNQRIRAAAGQEEPIEAVYDRLILAPRRTAHAAIAEIRALVASRDADGKAPKPPDMNALIQEEGRR